MTDMIESIQAASYAVAQLNRAAEESARAWQELGAEMKRQLDLMLAALSPAEHARYDALIAAGWYPLDALCELDKE